MIQFKRTDHIMITIPEGSSAEARAFYGNTLGLIEIPGNHPSGAMWFTIADIELHLREEKAGAVSGRHAAFEVIDLPAARVYLESKNIDIQLSSDIQGRDRFFFRDPFHNRFELLEYKRS